MKINRKSKMVILNMQNLPDKNEVSPICKQKR